MTSIIVEITNYFHFELMHSKVYGPSRFCEIKPLKKFKVPLQILIRLSFVWSVN